eukprot:1133438-Pelagomonas_calceolata.AAC.5
MTLPCLPRLKDAKICGLTRQEKGNQDLCVSPTPKEDAEIYGKTPQETTMPQPAAACFKRRHIKQVLVAAYFGGLQPPRQGISSISSGLSSSLLWRAAATKAGYQQHQ